MLNDAWAAHNHGIFLRPDSSVDSAARLLLRILWLDTSTSAMFALSHSDLARDIICTLLELIDNNHQQLETAADRTETMRLIEARFGTFQPVETARCATGVDLPSCPFSAPADPWANRMMRQVASDRDGSQK